MLCRVSDVISGSSPIRDYHFVKYTWYEITWEHLQSVSVRMFILPYEKKFVSCKRDLFTAKGCRPIFNDIFALSNGVLQIVYY